MAISDSILLNGKYAIPRLMLHQHYYADKFIECDLVIWSRVWYSECLHAYTCEERGVCFSIGNGSSIEKIY